MSHCVFLFLCNLLLGSSCVSFYLNSILDIAVIINYQVDSSI